MSEMTQTVQSFNTYTAETKSVLDSIQSENEQTAANLQATATFQESIIATQTVIIRKEEEKSAILEAAEKARENPEVKGVDPVIDHILLSTNLSIGDKSQKFKGILYTQGSVPGANQAVRIFNKEYLDTNDDDHVLIIATHNPSKFPSRFTQIKNNADKGNYNFLKTIINDQSYFSKSINYGLGIEVASMVIKDDDCYVLTFLRLNFDDNTSPWIDYLIDVNTIILSTDQPLCEGT